MTIENLALIVAVVSLFAGVIAPTITGFVTARQAAKERREKRIMEQIKSLQSDVQMLINLRGEISAVNHNAQPGIVRKLHGQTIGFLLTLGDSELYKRLASFSASMTFSFNRENEDSATLLKILDDAIQIISKQIDAKWAEKP